MSNTYHAHGALLFTVFVVNIFSPVPNNTFVGLLFLKYVVGNCGHARFSDRALFITAQLQGHLKHEEALCLDAQRQEFP